MNKNLKFRVFMETLKDLDEPSGYTEFSEKSPQSLSAYPGVRSYNVKDSDGDDLLMMGSYYLFNDLSGQLVGIINTSVLPEAVLFFRYHFFGQFG